jgi:GTP-binding protein
MTLLGSYISTEKMPPKGRLTEVAFVGRSNVGKSSLINNLLNRKRLAPTSTTPGKTRKINLYEGPKGWQFVDLPGYGFAQVSEKIASSWAEHLGNYLAERPDIILFLFDIRRDFREQDISFLQWMQKIDKTPILVLTKADKLTKNRRMQRSKELLKNCQDLVAGHVLYSTLESTGNKELWALLRTRS